MFGAVRFYSKTKTLEPAKDNKHYHMKELFSSFHLNGLRRRTTLYSIINSTFLEGPHTLGFHSDSNAQPHNVKNSSVGEGISVRPKECAGKLENSHSSS